MSVFARRLALVVLVAVAVLLPAGGAQAASLFKDGAGRLVWSTSSATGTNSLDLTQNNPVFGGTTRYVFTSHVETTSVPDGIGCGAARTAAADEAIVCEAAGVPGIFLNLFNGPDTVRTGFCEGPVITCLGVVNPTVPIEISGWNGVDNLQGGSAADSITGNGGDDTVDGKGGGDRLDVDPGAEPAGGGRADGDDTLTGGLGNDTISGGAGGDTISGGDGDDTLTGGTENDLITGGAGDENVVDGGTGIDGFSYDDGRTSGVRVTLEPSATQNDGGTADAASATARESLVSIENVTGTAAADELEGSVSANTLRGRDGPDDLAGGEGGDRLFGEDGTDFLDGGVGADTMNGGTGTGDAVSYELRTGPVTVDLGTAGANDGSNSGLDGPGGGQDDIDPGSVEELIGGAGNDDLDGNSLAQDLTIDGRGGDDTIQGGGGDDVLIGRSGADMLDGRAGTHDGADYADHAQGVQVTLDGIRNDGNATDGAARDNVLNVEDLRGSPGDDSLFGNVSGSIANVIEGTGGNDVIRGGVGFATDELDGGAGTDTIDYGDRGGSITASLDGVANDGGTGAAENDELTGFEVLAGSPFGDTLSATDNAEIRGGAGNDLMSVGSNGGRLLGEAGNDDMSGGTGADTLDGGPDTDLLNGRDGSDTVLGGDGDDNIEARDNAADAIDCGNGEQDSASTDAVDTRANCELPAPPPLPPPPAPPAPPPAKVLRAMSVTVSFNFFPRKPKRTTRFTAFKVKNVPRGSKVVARCLTKKGKRCKGKLGKKLTRSNARGTLKVKVFNKRFPAGSRLEVVVTNPDFVTQIKTVRIIKNKAPEISTACLRPGARKRTRC